MRKAKNEGESPDGLSGNWLSHSYRELLALLLSGSVVAYSHIAPKDMESMSRHTTRDYAPVQERSQLSESERKSLQAIIDKARKEHNAAMGNTAGYKTEESINKSPVGRTYVVRAYTPSFQAEKAPETGMQDVKGGTTGSKAYSDLDSIVRNYDRILQESFSGVSRQSIGSQIGYSAKRYGIDPELSDLVAMQESKKRQFSRNGKPIESAAGAIGLYQLMKEGAAVDELFELCFNPARAGAADNYKEMLERLRPLLSGGYDSEIRQLYEEAADCSRRLSSDKFGDKKKTELKARKELAEKRIESLKESVWNIAGQSYAANAEMGNAYLKKCMIDSDNDRRLGNRDGSLNPKELLYALSAYNAGKGNVSKAKGIPRIPETNKYVDTVGEKYLREKGLAPTVHFGVGKVKNATPWSQSSKYGLSLKEYYRLNPKIKENGLKANDVVIIRKGADPDMPLFPLDKGMYKKG